MQWKRAILATTGGAVMLGSATFGGLALAQTPGTSTPASGTPSAAQQQRQAQANQFLDDLAKNLGVTRSKLDDALKATQTQEIDAAVKAGTITQAQATALKQRIASGTAPFGVGFGPGFGFGGDPGRGFGGVQITGLQDAIDKAFQQKAGVTRQQFMQEVQAGKMPDAVFAAHNTTALAVGQAEAAAAKPLLDQAVQQQQITQAQETAFLDRLQNGPGFGPGRGGRGGPGGPGGAGAPGQPSAAPTATQ